MTHKRRAGCGEGGCWEGAGKLHGALGWAGQLWGPGGVRSPQWVADPERASQAPETLLLYPGVFPAASDGTWGNLDGGPELLLGHPAHPRVSRALSWWECRRRRRTGLVCREGSGSEPQHEGSSIAAQGAPQGAGHRDRSQAPPREPGKLEGLMLKLKLQYFGHLMQRADSLEKTVMLGKIEGRRRRG